MGFLEIVGSIIMFAGGIIALIGAVMFLVAAFRQSGAMGCGMMIPFIGNFIQIYFILTSWDEAKKPLFIQIAGIVLFFLGAPMAGVDFGDELDSDMAGYYEEYYEDYYEDDGGEEEAGSPLSVQHQRQRIAEREARNAPVEDSPTPSARRAPSSPPPALEPPPSGSCARIAGRVVASENRRPLRES